jgi:hypothetical protein
MLPTTQILLKTSLYLYQDSQLNISHLFLSWWVRQCRTWREAVPHPGTATLSAALLHLSDRWEARGIYTSPCPPQWLSHLLQWFRPTKTDQSSPLSSSIGTPWAPKQLHLFFHQSLRAKGVKTQLESSSTYSNFKRAFGSCFGQCCVCYSWSFALSRLERRSVSLPSLWQPQEVCNHLLQRVKSPLTSRASPLDLRTR